MFVKTGVLSILIFVLFFNFSGVFPVYELFQRLVVFLAFLFLFKERTKSEILALIALVCYLCILNIEWLALNKEEGSYVSSFIYVVPCFLVYFLLCKDVFFRRGFYVKLIYFVAFFMVFEAFVRYAFPETFVSEQQLEMSRHFLSKYTDHGVSSFIFYRYKLSSISFFDSNYVGIFCFYCLVLLMYLDNEKKHVFLCVVLFTLILLSLSRASIVMSVISLSILLFWNSSVWKKCLIIFVVLSLLPIVLLPYIDLLISDSSFLSKISIMFSISHLIEFDTYYQLFGFGFPYGGYIYSHSEGAYAHSLYAIVLGQLGIIGLLAYLFSLLLCYISSQSKIYTFTIILFSLGVGVSLINPWSPFLFCCLALVSNKRNLY